MPNTPWYDKSPMPVRFAGAFLVFIGFLGLLFGAVLPSNIGVNEIILLSFGLPSLVTGALYIGWGQNIVPHLGEPQNMKSWRLRYWAPLFVIGFILALVLRSQNGA
jgi:asparagine N-glycosylation enzyme membrane subunit Stt3